MNMDVGENTEEFKKIYQSLTKAQKAFVRVRHKHGTGADAARAIGINPKTVYQWKSSPDGDKLKRAIKLVDDHAADTLMARFEGLAQDIADTFEQLSKEANSERVRLEAAKYLADHLIGKPVQRQQVETTDKDALSNEDLNEAQKKLIKRLTNNKDAK